MKRFCTILALAAMLVLPLPGCGKQEDTSSSATAGGGMKLGLGCVAALAMDGTEKTAVKATAAAVLLDKDGVIRRCRLDETEFSIALEGGRTVEPTGWQTKGEQGAAYKPTDRDTGGSGELSSPWQEQARAFCAYVEGKTAGEVSGIAATDGKSSEIAGCDLIITDFIKAVRKAADMATEQTQAAAADTLQLALTAGRAEGATAAAPQYDVELSAVSLDTQKRITGCYADTLQVKLKVEENTFAMTAGDVSTKRDMGDAYGMKAASGIKKEWYEQAAAFDAYAVGKTAAELAAVKLDGEGKTDAITGCTVAVSGLVKNTVKAAGMAG